MYREREYGMERTRGKSEENSERKISPSSGIEFEGQQKG